MCVHWNETSTEKRITKKMQLSPHCESTTTSSNNNVSLKNIKKGKFTTKTCEYHRELLFPLKSKKIKIENAENANESGKSEVKSERPEGEQHTEFKLKPEQPPPAEPTTKKRATRSASHTLAEVVRGADPDEQRLVENQQRDNASLDRADAGSPPNRQEDENTVNEEQRGQMLGVEEVEIGQFEACQQTIHRRA